MISPSFYSISSKRILNSSIIRRMSSTTSKPDGIVLLIDSNGKPISSTSSASSFDSASFESQWSNSRASSEKFGQLRTFYPQDAQSPVITAVSLGRQKPAPTTASDKLPAANIYLRNELQERTRLAAAKGIKAVRDVGSSVKKEKDSKAPTPRTIAVEPTSLPHASAVGAHLALWKCDLFKSKNGTFGLDPQLQAGREIEVIPLGGDSSKEAKQELKDENDEVKADEKLSWWTGEVYAKAQNYARDVGETPANLMTPTIFCDRAVAAFKGIPNVKIDAFDEDWARSQNMNTFLSVTNGTAEPAKFLQIKYTGAKDPNAPTLAFVGKGITFDSGGISIKGGAGMKLMRADMLGAGTCVAATLAIAQLGLPINVVTCTPLCENMPSGTATKPGDIIVSKKGLTVEVDNTDAEGRLVLADALTYVSQEFKPHTLIDVATLTGAILHALGHVYTGTFTEDESLWQELKAAGEAEHDRFWRMPGAEDFMYSIAGSNADLCNKGSPAGSACAAVFLKQFVEGLEDRDGLESGEGKAKVRYAHLDIAGTMESDHGSSDYQARALTGRPTRSLIEFARRFGAASVAV